MSSQQKLNSYFSTRFTEDYRREFIWRQIENYVDKLLPKSEATLELGAGYCDWINASNSNIKYATDISDNIKKYAAGEVQTIVVNCTDLIIENMKFDRIQASNFFEHLDDATLEKTIERILPLIKEGGHLIVIQPNYRYSYKKYFDDYTHKKIFTHISLIDYFKSKDFSPIVVKKKFLPFSLKSKLRFGYRLIKIYLYSPFKPFAGQMLIIFQKNIST